MKVFKKKGELTHFQILAEIARGQPHLRQKDIADKLGITVQAVSENIKNLVDEGFVETGMGRSKYKITKRGIEKVKTEAANLRKYADNVLETMNTYKSVWPAIARQKLKPGEKVWLEMENGTLYATKEKKSAYAEVLNEATTYKSVWPAIARQKLKPGEKVWLEMENGTLYATKEKKSAYAEVLNEATMGEDVALIKLGGTIELKPGSVVILKLPTINQGGSRACDLEKIISIYEKGSDNMRFDRVGEMGTVSRAVTEKLDIKADFEFATPDATLAAAKRGLNVLVFAVGKMTKSITRKLDSEGVNYVIEDVTKSE
ncbi:MAG: winged helix-turn-helix transcriptional regulator [Methanobacterium paludis]|nr:winged helix-turn-helix transcriptional regulator [Methanobacterium paludis]